MATVSVWVPISHTFSDDPIGLMMKINQFLIEAKAGSVVCGPRGKPLIKKNGSFTVVDNFEPIGLVPKILGDFGLPGMAAPPQEVVYGPNTGIPGLLVKATVWVDERFDKELRSGVAVSVVGGTNLFGANLFPGDLYHIVIEIGNEQGVVCVNAETCKTDAQIMSLFRLWDMGANGTFVIKGHVVSHSNCPELGLWKKQNVAVYRSLRFDQ